MTDDDLINEDAEPVPLIAGRRIDMFDVMAALESDDPEHQFYDVWELSEEQVEAAIEYVREHRDWLDELEQEQTPDTRIIQPTEDVDEIHEVDKLRYERLDHECIFVAGYTDDDDETDYKMWFQCTESGVEVKIEEHDE